MTWGFWALHLRDQGGYVEHPPLRPAAQPEFGELHPLRALEQVPAKRAAVHDMTQEELPFRLERVLVAAVGGHLLPVAEEVDRLRDVRVPYGLWRRRARLHPAVGQARDRRSERAVDME